MPRYYKRRYYKRRYNTLKSTNIAMNKSARSQARQIMALSRRVSYVHKLARPETRISQYTAQLPDEFVSTSTGATLTGNVPWIINTAGSSV